MAKIKELLPNGSVVLLKGGNKKLMTMGILQSSEEGKAYDYIALPYPEGYLGPDNIFMFQHEDIMDVIYKGYNNSEREEFLEFATQLMEAAEKIED